MSEDKVQSYFMKSATHLSYSCILISRVLSDSDTVARLNLSVTSCKGFLSVKV